MEKYCIVRCDRAGVFAGNVVAQNGQEVTMENARRLWRWDGATECIGLATSGTKKPTQCRFTVTVPEITVLDAIEVIPCTAEAEASIKGVAEWKA